MDMDSGFWIDDSNPDKAANPRLALADAREAHGWASRQLASAVNPNRVYNLTQERNRLAAIAWRLKARC